MIYLLIKKNVPNLLVENRAKTGTNRAKPTRTPQGHAHSCRRRSKGHKMTSTTQTQPNGDPLRQTIRSPTPAEEKKPRLLWEEQTRDASAKVKKPHSTRPLAKSDPDTPTTSVESHPIAHTTQGQKPSKLTISRSRRPDFPPLCRALRGQPRPPSGAAAPTYHHWLSSCNAARPSHLAP